MTSGLFPSGLAVAMLASMDAPAVVELPVAETLPEVYRRVLDRVAALEAAGHRTEADRVRADAIRAYSKRWNERAANRLARLIDRADRVLDGRERARAPYRPSRLALVARLVAAPFRLRRRFVARSAPAPVERAAA
ncbi:MAG TPA: hypothetical protein VFP19_06510 [Candidatus Limnocylindrales bacterium]|nr:hypothetical protein [Candidatus Limnocylindrales bacterium]